MEVKLDNLDRFIDKINDSFGIVLIFLVAGIILILYSRQINKFYKPLSVIVQFFTVAFLAIGFIGLGSFGVLHVLNTNKNLEIVYQEKISYVNISDDNLQKEFQKLSQDNNRQIAELEKNILALKAENNSLKNKASEVAIILCIYTISSGVRGQTEVIMAISFANGISKKRIFN